jgi:general secretion pathway protein C
VPRHSLEFGVGEPGAPDGVSPPGDGDPDCEGDGEPLDGLGDGEAESGDGDGAVMPAATMSVATATTTSSAPAGMISDGEISAEAIKAGLSFAPRKEGQAITGIRVQPQGDGAIFRAAGLRQDDVIRAINGRPITSAADVAGLASALRPGARLSLDVERGTARVPIALFLAKS